MSNLAALFLLLSPLHSCTTYPRVTIPVVTLGQDDERTATYQGTGGIGRLAVKRRLFRCGRAWWI